MKTIIVILATFLTVSFASADSWCEWDGSQGVNCQSDGRGYILIEGRPTKTESIANAAGWFKVTDTQPSIGADQVIDAEIWEKVGNQINLTWSVRDMTAEEIDGRDAGAMDITDYYIWKALLVTGTITQQQAIDNLPAEMIDAYQARKRLLGD